MEINATVIIAGLAVFGIVTLLLVGLLLVAKAQLVQSGDVKIVINGNDNEPIVVPAGSTLLSTLGENKIFLAVHPHK